MLLSGSLIGLGALFVLLALPLWARRIPPNRAYGFRTPLTVSNAQVWYATNAVAGRDLVVAGVCMMGLGGLLPLLAVSPERMPLVFVVSVMGPMLAAVLHTFWWASRYVSQRTSGCAGRERDRAADPDPPETEMPFQRGSRGRVDERG